MKPRGLHVHSNSLPNMSWKTRGYSWIAWIVMFYENMLPWHPIFTMCDGDMFKSFFQSPTLWEPFWGSLIRMETTVIRSYGCRTLLNDRSCFHRACGERAVSTQIFITTHCFWLFFFRMLTQESFIINMEVWSHTYWSAENICPL